MKILSYITFTSQELLRRSEQIEMEYLDVGIDKLLQIPWVGNGREKQTLSKDDIVSQFDLF